MKREIRVEPLATYLEKYKAPTSTVTMEISSQMEHVRKQT
jgi:hypothetical protein